MRDIHLDMTPARGPQNVHHVFWNSCFGIPSRREILGILISGGLARYLWDYLWDYLCRREILAILISGGLARYLWDYLWDYLCRREIQFGEIMIIITIIIITNNNNNNNKQFEGIKKLSTRAPPRLPQYGKIEYHQHYPANAR